jgi:4,5-DOPA dioxygenase extradiol
MTLPYPWTDKQLFELGQCLAPLRREGVMILGTGVLTHNLAELDMAEQQPVPDWARDFDQWVADTLDRGELDALIHWQERAPEARCNHPGPEHFRPLLVVAGAAWGDKVSYPVTGFEYGSLSRRCVQFGVTR